VTAVIRPSSPELSGSEPQAMTRADAAMSRKGELAPEIRVIRQPYHGVGVYTKLHRYAGPTLADGVPVTPRRPDRDQRSRGSGCEGLVVGARDDARAAGRPRGD